MRHIAIIVNGNVKCTFVQLNVTHLDCLCFVLMVWIAVWLISLESLFHP